MMQIPDAPWIREADAFGYPVDEEDEDILDCGDCPCLRI